MTTSRSFPGKATGSRGSSRCRCTRSARGSSWTPGVEDSRVVEHYLGRVVAAKVQAGEPALVYGHPERRLGRMPEILIAPSPPAGEAIAGLAGHPDRARPLVAVAEQPPVHGLAPRGEPLRDPVRRVGPRVPAGAGDLPRRLLRRSLPLSGPRTVVALDELVYERASRLADGVIVPPSLDHRHDEPEGRRGPRAGLGDGDAASRAVGRVAPGTAQERAAMVEAAANGDRRMTPTGRPQSRVSPSPPRRG